MDTLCVSFFNDCRLARTGSNVPGKPGDALFTHTQIQPMESTTPA
jgi:hypothetical protein